MGKFDEIFDDVVVNAKVAASAVSKKATDVYDTSKQKIAAAEIRGEINKLLRDLGALTYKTKTQNFNADDEASKIIEEITDYKDQLKVINRNISSAKSKKRCPSCDAVVPKNSLYCNICGVKFDSERNAEETAEYAE